MKKDLQRLLRPKSVAVFGGAWAENVVLQCQRMNFCGDIWPVNPHRDSMGGIPCINHINDLPGVPDAAFIGVNRHAAVKIAADLSAVNCGGAVCFASGFAESGNKELQQQLIAAAADMPLLGPNCYGIINYLDGALLWPDQHGGVRSQKGAAIIGQSSNILINITSQKRGLPISYLAAAGNQAQTTMSDIARGMLADDRVRAIGFYIEGIKDIADFADMARCARSRGVFLAAIKSGKCAAATAAAASHTATLTGGAAASSAFLRRCNIAEVQTLPELLEILKLFYCGGVRGRRIMSLSCSGGEAGHIADLSADKNLSLPPPPPQQQKELKTQLGELVNIANPLDYHTFIWHDEAALYKTYCAALRCGNDLTILIYDYPRADRCDLHDWDLPMRAFMRAVADVGVAAAVVSSLPENMPESVAQQLLAANITPLCGLSEALSAIMIAAAVAENNNMDFWQPLPVVLLTQPQLMDEAAAKVLLQQNGIPCPLGRRADTPTTAAAAAVLMTHDISSNSAAVSIAPIKFAIKSLNLSHKTDVGGVLLNIDARDVESAAAAMPLSGGFLIEEMIVGGKVELLIGARRDPVYGATLTLGMGGIHAEVFADTETLILPTTTTAIAAAFGRLRMSPLLHGHRGDNGADIAAAVIVAQKAATMLESQKHIMEIEINPLIVRAPGAGAIAADALINYGRTS